jgi:pilus assembly protein CpaB
MNRRLATILAFACFIAGGCALLVYRIVNTRLVAARPEVSVHVVAAAQDLKIGAILTPANLTTVAMVGSVPTGAILKSSDAVGRGVVADIYKGEPILDGLLAPRGSGGGLAATIPPGMRACAVKVDDVVGLAGFVTPGMRVDVLVSGNPPGANSAQDVVTKTILQNIQVLSAGTDIQKDAEGKPQQVQVVNLLVNPEQAEKLSLATNQLKIQLVLRNPLDTKVDDVPATAMGTLFSGAAPSPHPVEVARRVSRPEPHTFSIEVINGSHTSQEKFSAPDAEN